MHGGEIRTASGKCSWSRACLIHRDVPPSMLQVRVVHEVRCRSSPMPVHLPNSSMLAEGLGRRSAPWTVAAGLLLISLLGVIDYLTGYEFSFAVFYLLPVALVAWFAGRRLGLLIATISAATWQYANLLAGESFSSLVVPYWNAATRLGFFVVVVLLLARLRETLLRQTELARTDFLTRALNQRAFYDSAEIEIERARRYRRSFSLAYLDADNFKAVNDRFGHHVGSQLLVRVVEVMKQNLRSTDVVARLGGDEFAVLLPETDAGEAQELVEKLRQKLHQEMMASGWPVTFSIGALTCQNPPESVDEMLKIVDGLMYEAKKDGKDTLRHIVLDKRSPSERV